MTLLKLLLGLTLLSVVACNVSGKGSTAHSLRVDEAKTVSGVDKNIAGVLQENGDCLNLEHLIGSIALQKNENVIIYQRDGSVDSGTSAGLDTMTTACTLFDAQHTSLVEYTSADDLVNSEMVGKYLKNITQKDCQVSHGTVTTAASAPSAPEAAPAAPFNEEEIFQKLVSTAPQKPVVPVPGPAKPTVAASKPTVNVPKVTAKSVQFTFDNELVTYRENGTTLVISVLSKVSPMTITREYVVNHGTADDKPILRRSFALFLKGELKNAPNELSTIKAAGTGRDLENVKVTIGTMLNLEDAIGARQFEDKVCTSK